jgi:hypothetical protein
VNRAPMVLDPLDNPAAAPLGGVRRSFQGRFRLGRSIPHDTSHYTAVLSDI